jgi:hypothetical protein
MFPQATLRCSLITNRLARGGGDSMTRLPYHDLPPDPTGRSPRGIGWKVSPSGRLRSGWASRRGRYTSDWSASECNCANNWRNRGEIPSQSPLEGTQVWLWRLLNC